MNPLGQPVNTSPQSPATAPPGAPSAGLDPLSPATGLGDGIKPATPPDTNKTKQAAKFQRIEDVKGVLAPAGAVAAVFLTPESVIGRKALHFLTGFKAAEGAELANKIGPGAIGFLAPEPIGLLPERFFMDKPRVPGTGIYLDPLHNATHYLERRDQDKREAAGRAQVNVLREALPQLTTESLALVLNSPELRSEFLAFAPPKQVDAVIFTELERRRVAGESDPAVLAELRRQQATANRQVLDELNAAFFTGDLYTAGALVGYLRSQGEIAPHADSSVVNPLVEPIRGGSIQVERIPALTGTAIRQQATAEGLNKELVTERVDP